MAHIFLSQLKAALDNCIDELEQIHFYNPEIRTFIHEGGKGYNAVHINALYDIINKTYCDFHVQGKKKLHERAALNLMIDCYPDPVPSILMADCGYESFFCFTICSPCLSFNIDYPGTQNIVLSHIHVFSFSYHN